MTRLYLAGAALLALVATFGAGWLAGADHQRDKYEVRGVRAYAAIAETVAKVGDAVEAIAQDLSARLAESHESERTAVRTVTRIVRENPDFAAVRRPAELERVRRDQLARIARAAEADRLQR